MGISLIKYPAIDAKLKGMYAKQLNKNDLLELSKQPDVLSVISSLKSKFSPLEGIRDKATRVEVEDALDNVLIEDINTKELDLDLAAGKVNINNINVLNDTKIDGGAGKLTMDNVTLNNLKLSLGAGSSKINGVFKGNSEIECSVGRLDLTLLDSINNYALDIDKSTSKVYVNSKKITDERYTTNGENPLKIEGAVGSINIVTND